MLLTLNIAEVHALQLLVKPSYTLCMQVGRYGGLEEEVEHLKRDKNLLMLELVRLRQQQQVFKADWHVSFLVNPWTVAMAVAMPMPIPFSAFHRQSVLLESCYTLAVVYVHCVTRHVLHLAEHRPGD